MKTISKTLLSLLLLCLLGAAGKGYGQEVKPGTVLWEFLSGFHVNSSPAIGSDGTSMSGHMTIMSMQQMVRPGPKNGNL